MHKKYNKEFHNHKHSAKKRGIKFILTFEEWLGIWNKSGKILKRGRRPEQYCMSRLSDKGPYKVGNVKIITSKENRAEMKLSKRTRDLMRAAKLGRRLSKEHRAKISAANTGGKLSAEACANISRSKMGRKNPMFGRKASARTRKLLSQIRRGLRPPLSAEEKRKKRRIHYLKSRQK